MKPEEFTRHLEQIKLQLEQLCQRDAPRIAGKIAVDHFSENFQKEGFVNNGLRKWAEVKRRLSTKTKGAAASRKILTGDTGNLGRSLSSDAARGQVTVYSDVPYAVAHNQGSNNAGRSRNVVIPKRQFMGDSAELDKKITKEIERKLRNIKS